MEKNVIKGIAKGVGQKSKDVCEILISNCEAFNCKKFKKFIIEPKHTRFIESTVDTYGLA